MEKEKEEIKRDLERVEEYGITLPQTIFISSKEVEVSTGLIIAARYADKIRRAIFAIFGKVLPTEIILRDVAEFNKKLYDEIVKRKIDKLDVIRIRFKVSYDAENKKLEFKDYEITRYIEEGKLNEECKKYKEMIENIKKLLSS